jgi:hypothetical protein
MSDSIMVSKKRRYWRKNRKKLFALVKPLITEIPPRNNEQPFNRIGAYLLP